ncbi:MAG TPA: hypothetical protein VMY15_04110 [Candidatus Latescibacteria bacterium]|nr:hypothetical protein [Candidatus Latescibacterota bacterium]
MIKARNILVCVVVAMLVVAASAGAGPIQDPITVVDSFESRLEAIRGIGSDMAADVRPGVYLSFWGSLLRTPVFYEPVDAAGGTNLAAGPPGIILNEGLLKAVYDIEMGILNVGGRRLIVR